MRNLSVERFIPKRSAAPLDPAITHFVFFNVSRIRSRSVVRDRLELGFCRCRCDSFRQVLKWNAQYGP